MQSVGLSEVFEEQPIEIDSELVSFWFASAVTLTTGNIVLTGGRHTAHEAVLRSNGIWTRLPQMLHGRYGHSSCSVFLEDNEHVLVAGGWDREGGVQATVELYKISQPKRGWRDIGRMVSPRTLFTLQVKLLT